MTKALFTKVVGDTQCFHLLYISFNQAFVTLSVTQTYFEVITKQITTTYFFIAARLCNNNHLIIIELTKVGSSHSRQINTEPLTTDRVAVFHAGIANIHLFYLCQLCQTLSDPSRISTVFFNIQPNMLVCFFSSGHR